MLSLRRRRSIFKPPCSVIRGWTERGSRTTTEVPPSREEESRGEKHQISPQAVVDHVTQAAEVSSPLARPTAQEQDGTPRSPSGAVVNDVSSGGARGGTERSRAADHRGGAEGGDGGDAEQPAYSPISPVSRPRGRSQRRGESRRRQGRQRGRQSRSQQAQPLQRQRQQQTALSLCLEKGSDSDSEQRVQVKYIIKVRNLPK
ncbi:uncharacterized protein [Chamaea fasciata]|uniref:uncharacterized protein isoform X1 n=1 Tax=Chamaea fasciata TaxID=190680 RepID=UPI003369E918